MTGGQPADRLAHVRWLVGGTAAGKSTVARLLADRHGLEVYDGDGAERAWLGRCTPQRHPHLSALRILPPGGMWEGRTAQQVFRAMPGLHGETIAFVVEDLLARQVDRALLVDYFGVLPDQLAPLLSRPGQAAFLLPTPEFRQKALHARYADPARARANLGSADAETVLTKRLARDLLWDEEVRRQAERHGFDILVIDGSTPAADLAGRLARRFGLGSSRSTGDAASRGR